MAANKDEVIAAINALSSRLDAATTRIDAQDAVIEELKDWRDHHSDELSAPVLAEFNQALDRADQAAQRHEEALTRIEDDDPTLPHDHRPAPVDPNENPMV